MNRKLTSSFLVILLLFPSPGYADSDEHPAMLALVSMTNQFFSIMEDNRKEINENSSSLVGHIMPLVNESVDVEHFGLWALGKEYRKIRVNKSIGEAEMARYYNAVTHYLARTYARALISLKKDNLNFIREKQTSRKNKVEVIAKLDMKNGSDVDLIFFMKEQSDKSWRLWDVSIDGIRLTISSRSSFSRRIKHSGFMGLVQELEKKVETKVFVQEDVKRS